MARIIHNLRMCVSSDGQLLEWADADTQWTMRLHSWG
jgi:hypothetical protein